MSPPLRLLIACMPKSGSTFLTSAAAGLFRLRIKRLVPGYGRREQELCEGRLAMASLGGGFIAQHHVRASPTLAKLRRRYGLTTIVLVRNVFDVVESAVDHWHRESPEMPMAYVSDEMLARPRDDLRDAFIDLALPWCFNFYLTWLKEADCPILRYEDLLADRVGTLRRIGATVGRDVSEAAAQAALAAVSPSASRLNVGVTGRGSDLSHEARRRILRLASHYPDVDFGPIGIPFKDRAAWSRPRRAADGLALQGPRPA